MSFQPGDIVECYGSEGQFFCYAVVKDDEFCSKKFGCPRMTGEWVSVFMYKNKQMPEVVQYEDVYGFGGTCFKEGELKFVKKAEVDMKLREIPVNIWDDYWDDGCIPEGDCQETYAYVEEYDRLSEEQKEKIIQFLFDHIKENFEMPEVKIKANGTDLEFIHLTHERREELLKWLENSKLEYEGTPFCFYSES